MNYKHKKEAIGCDSILDHYAKQQGRVTSKTVFLSVPNLKQVHAVDLAATSRANQTRGGQEKHAR